MAKITLDPVAGGYDLSVINNNFDKLETELNTKVLYRNNPAGEPNTLETDVDINSKRIYNLPEPLLDSEAARLQDVQNALAGGAANLIQFTPYNHVTGNNLQLAIQELIDDSTNNNTFVVDSISQLKDINKTQFTKAIVLGYYSKGDGGGGVYWYDASDTTSADNGGTIIVATDGARWKLSNQSILTARQFGAKGDGVTDDTISINTFLQIAGRGHLSAGSYKITTSLLFKSDQTITGDGTSTVIIYAAISPPASQPVLHINGKSNVLVSGFKLQVPPATYTDARSINIENSTNCHVEDIVFSGAGGNAAYISGSTGCSVKRIRADDYRSNGFYVNGGSGNKIEDCDIPDGTNGLMGIQLVGGEGNKALNNRIAKTPDNYFGIHAYGGNFPVIAENHVKNTRREAIALGGSQFGARVTDNTCYWDVNLGIGDFGISAAGDDASTIVADFMIANNTIMNSAYDAVGIAGWTQRGRVIDNVIRDSARAGLVTHQSGIKLYGWITGAVTDDIEVSGNSISKIDSTGLLYAVSEDPALGSVSGNIIRDNKTFGLTGDIYPISTARVSLNSNDLQLQTGAVTISSSTGTITTASGTFEYQKVGKRLYSRITVSITNNGTGAGAVLVTLPFNTGPASLSGAEGAVNGKACKAGKSAANQLSITNYDNTYPGANGVNLVIFGSIDLN